MVGGFASGLVVGGVTPASGFAVGGFVPVVGGVGVDAVTPVFFGELVVPFAGVGVAFGFFTSTVPFFGVGVGVGVGL